MKSPGDMLAELGKPFPKTAIKQRRGGGGKSLSYVETHTVINRLNSATNGEWSFHIKDVQWRNDVLMVQGELTIPGLGTRSGFGVQQVVERAGEDLVKGAASDALKKCATLFGVALELYGADYEANVSVQAPQRPPDAPKPASAGASTPATPQGDWDAASARMHAVGGKHGFSHEELRQLCDREEWLANKRNITTTKDAPPALMRYVTDLIEKNPTNQRKWLDQRAKQTQELMPGMDAVPNPTTANHYTDH